MSTVNVESAAFGYISRDCRPQFAAHLVPNADDRNLAT